MHHLVLVGGPAGTGKTHVGKELAKNVGIFLDKDTITRYAIEMLLIELGSHRDDRESAIYLENVRDVEYQTMIKVAIENLELGKTVICSAPFLREFSDSEWLEDLEIEAEINDARILKVWVHADADTTRRRLMSRDAARDTWKLANWASYIAVTPHRLPDDPSLYVIDNTEASDLTLESQIATVLLQLGSIS